MISRWCSASEVYISEQKVRTAGEATALADDYFLTHKGNSGDPHTYAFVAGGGKVPAKGMYFSVHFREQRLDSWASPCLLVQSDNTPRFCLDFRNVNSVTKPDSYPLPHIVDYIDQVGAGKLISKFDLLKVIGRSLCLKGRSRLQRLSLQLGCTCIPSCLLGYVNAPATFQL